MWEGKVAFKALRPYLHRTQGIDGLRDSWYKSHKDYPEYSHRE